MNLVASLIVKNELGRYLQANIGHLREFCDHIVVVDDGSTDRTGEWLDDHADEQIIVHHIDPEDGFFAGHEGRRRNMLLHHTMNQLPDFVLNIDADEFISDGAALREFAESPSLVGSLVMEEVWTAEKSALKLRMDGGWRAHPIPCFWNGRQLHGRRGRALKIRDSALACGREPEAVRSQAHRARPTGASIMHFGWTCETCRQGRYDRYVTADGGRFHRSAHLESIMWPDEKVKLEERPWPKALLSYRDDILRAVNGLP